MAAKRAQNKAEKRPPDRFRNRIVGEGFEDPADLVANPDNWRIHPAAQSDALAEALNGLGWIQRVIVNKRTGNLIDGHLRCSLAMREGARVPVLYVDLSEIEEKIALATIDPLSGLAVADREKLEALIQDIDLPEGSALAGMLDDLLTETPAPSAKSSGSGSGEGGDPVEVVRPGDLWMLGPHRLQCSKSKSADFAAVDAALRAFWAESGIEPVRGDGKSFGAIAGDE